MTSRGEWTHNGSAAGLRELAVRTKESGNKALMTRTRRAMNKAAQPAREAVQATERAVLPKAGGLNEWVASTPVRVSVLTGPKTAGVSIRQSKGGSRSSSVLSAEADLNSSRRGRIRPHDLRRLNEQGLVRHPVFADPDKNRRDWTWVAQYGLPIGWWEGALLPTRVQVTTEMLRILHETGYEAGFR